jgi:hypothetical protein
MPISNWSTTASSNATSDSASGIIWSEGQAPSSLNDSARAMMAAIKADWDNGYRLKRVVQYTASGTYTPSAGTRAIWVRAVGGGGGVRNLSITGNGSSAQAAAAPGSGAGAYGEAFIITPAASYTVTIGSGGTGGTSPTAGGTTSFGSVLSLVGGDPSGVYSFGTAEGFWAGGPGGVGTFTGGTGITGFAVAGESGDYSIRQVGTTVAGGKGGRSPFGDAGAPANIASSTDLTGPASAPSGYGAGASGYARVRVTASAVSTGVDINGRPGYVEIWEFA